MSIEKWPKWAVNSGGTVVFPIFPDLRRCLTVLTPGGHCGIYTRVEKHAISFQEVEKDV